MRLLLRAVSILSGLRWRMARPAKGALRGLSWLRPIPGLLREGEAGANALNYGHQSGRPRPSPREGRSAHQGSVRCNRHNGLSILAVNTKPVTRVSHNCPDLLRSAPQLPARWSTAESVWLSSIDQIRLPILDPSNSVYQTKFILKSHVTKLPTRAGSKVYS